MPKSKKATEMEMELHELETWVYEFTKNAPPFLGDIALITKIGESINKMKELIKKTK